MVEYYKEGKGIFFKHNIKVCTSSLKSLDSKVTFYLCKIKIS